MHPCQVNKIGQYQHCIAVRGGGGEKFYQFHVTQRQPLQFLDNPRKFDNSMESVITMKTFKQSANNYDKVLLQLYTVWFQYIN